jgi:hypothetical protein
MVEFFLMDLMKRYLKIFKTSMKKLGIGDDLTNKVIGDSAKFRVFVANLKECSVKRW